MVEEPRKAVARHVGMSESHAERPGETVMADLCSRCAGIASVADLVMCCNRINLDLGESKALPR